MKTLEEKYVVVSRALRLACQYIRQHPPAELPFDDSDLMMILVGGGPRDPEGKEYIGYFLSKAENLF